MTNSKVFVSYDQEGDMLEVLWAFREGYFTPTDDERILKRLDDDGEGHRVPHPRDEHPQGAEPRRVRACVRGPSR